MTTLNLRGLGLVALTLATVAAVGLPLTGRATDLTETDTLTGASSTQYGFAVAVNGGTAVVGAWADGDKGTQAGAAYVYERIDGTWTFEKKLYASNARAYDNFGRSVDVFGDFIVVGAPQAQGPMGTNTAGAAYVFRRNGTSWDEKAILLGSETVASDPYDQPQDGDDFGISVAINGDVPAESTSSGIVYNIVVGSWYDTHSQELFAGSAYLFQLSANGTAWNAYGKLISDTPTNSEGFGWDVDLDGDHMVIGTKNGNAAYVFVRHGSQNVWGLDTKLTAADGGSYGKSVAVYAISGHATIVIGAPDDSIAADHAGAIYVAYGSASSFPQQKYYSSDASVFQNFGTDVAVNRYVVIGSTDPSVVGDPQAYTFEPGNSGWTETHRLFGTTGRGPNKLAVGTDTVLIGDRSYPNGLSGSGATFVFEGLLPIFSDGFE